MTILGNFVFAYSLLTGVSFYYLWTLPSKPPSLSFLFSEPAKLLPWWNHSLSSLGGWHLLNVFWQIKGGIWCDILSRALMDSLLEGCIPLVRWAEQISTAQPGSTSHCVTFCQRHKVKLRLLKTCQQTQRLLPFLCVLNIPDEQQTHLDSEIHFSPNTLSQHARLTQTTSCPRGMQMKNLL